MPFKCLIVLVLLTRIFFLRRKIWVFVEEGVLIFFFVVVVLSKPENQEEVDVTN